MKDHEHCPWEENPVVFPVQKSRGIEGLRLLLKVKTRAFHGKLTVEKFCYTIFRRYA